MAYGSGTRSGSPGRRLKGQSKFFCNSDILMLPVDSCWEHVGELDGVQAENKSSCLCLLALFKVFYILEPSV